MDGPTDRLLAVKGGNNMTSRGLWISDVGGVAKMTEGRTMWVSMQVSIYMYVSPELVHVSLDLPFWGEGLSETLYSQIWSKCIF